MARGVVSEQAEDLGVTLEHLGPQLTLHEASGKLHERQVVRMRGLIAPGDVDRAERRAGLGIVDRRSRALPAVHRGAVMLGREDLDGGVRGQRGPDRVGAGRRLAPPVPGPEADSLRRPQHVRMAVGPQQAAVSVGNDDDVLRLVEQVAERVLENLGHPRQRVLAPAVACFGRLEQERGAGLAGIDPRLRAAFPGVGDHTADDRRHTAAADRRVVGTAQQPRPLARVDSGLKTHQAVAHSLCRRWYGPRAVVSKTRARVMNIRVSRGANVGKKLRQTSEILELCLAPNAQPT